ncbi:MAG: 1-acyl-sn-glycerol-3-phosphate acyltransferase [Verrucomicrobiales bacterium]|nr:1-acyl-sn-glycerol-3-phosphate acyltransferase [Verrucomicrobiales bacterium]
MNLQRTQESYVFRPPRPARWFRPLLHLIAAGFLRYRFNIRRLTVRGHDALRHLAHRRQSVLVTPNHADHADPCLLVEVGRRIGLSFHFMAARECFERGPVTRFVLQRSGAFSVDREGNDLASLRTAMSVLRAGHHPLVIFPEGEIYHHHEELDLLNEGAATIALRAAEKLPDGRRSHAIPTAIRIRHDPSVQNTFARRLATLERRITWKPQNHLDVMDRVFRLGNVLLAIKEEEYVGETRRGPLHERIVWLQEYLVESVERRHHLQPVCPQIPARIKTLRQRIRQATTANPTHSQVDPRNRFDDDLDRLFAAQQLYSYRGRYLERRPTVDRMAETLFKLEEDVLGEGTYPTPRFAEIVVGEPIEIEAFAQAIGGAPRTASAPLTRDLRRRIEDLLNFEVATDQRESTGKAAYNGEPCQIQ